MKSLKLTVYTVTLVVSVYCIISQLNVSFPIVFWLFLVSQGALIFMVYKVLTDNYRTKRTFEDWYGDKDIARNQ